MNWKKYPDQKPVVDTSPTALCGGGKWFLLSDGKHLDLGIFLGGAGFMGHEFQFDKEIYWADVELPHV